MEKGGIMYFDCGEATISGLVLDGIYAKLQKFPQKTAVFFNFKDSDGGIATPAMASMSFKSKKFTGTLGGCTTGIRKIVIDSTDTITVTVQAYT